MTTLSHISLRVDDNLISSCVSRNLMSCGGFFVCFFRTKNLDLDNHSGLAKMNEDMTINEKV